MNRKLRSKILVLFLVTFLILTASVQVASAKVTAFVAQDKAGVLYEYPYEDLLRSYVLVQLGTNSPLFSDYFGKDMTLFLDDRNGYVDYQAALAAYVEALINGKAFDLDKYTSGSGAKVMEVAKVLVVSEANGHLVFTEKEIADPLEVALYEVNNAKDASSLCRVIEMRAGVLALDLKAYNKLYEASKIAVGEGIMAERGKGFPDVEAFKSSFEQIVERVKNSVTQLLDSLNSSESVEAFSSLLMEDAEVFDLELDLYKMIISSRSAQVMTTVFAAVPFNNSQSLRDCFNSTVAEVLRSYVVVAYTPYNYSVQGMLDIQMPLKPQWYVPGSGWVNAPRSEVQHYVDPRNFILPDLPDCVEEIIVATGVLVVRDEPTSNGTNVANVKKGEIYRVLEAREVRGGTGAGSEGYWFKIQAGSIEGWVCGNYTDWVAGSHSPEMFQFLILSGKSGVSVSDLGLILAGKGILSGKEAVFFQASRSNNINEIFLTSLSLHETGNGTSQLAKGVLFTPTDSSLPPMTVYNMFGIGAVDSNPIYKGAEYAYNHGWFSPEEAIIGGAYFVARYYVNNSNYYQDTLYKMRWNPGAPGRHQYATDIGWASKQTSFIRQLYAKASAYNLRFDIPAYQD